MFAEVQPLSCPTLTPEDIVREVKHLPSAPKVLPRLKQLLCDGNSAMHEIVALIRVDPGIAARVLQMGNSAYFSKGVRCFTVEEAVNRVGYDQVYELVSYAVASQVLVRPVDSYGIDADELWAMSVACALGAEALAQHTHQDRSVAYTIGLLHCVGMVAIDEWILRTGQPLCFRHGSFPREAIEAERKLLGFTQAETGAVLLQHWEFPETISEPVRWQYAPRSAGGYVPMTSLLYVARWIRSTVCAPTPAARPPALDPILLQPLRLTASGLSLMADDVKRRVNALSTLLDTNGSLTTDRQRFPSKPPFATER
jgi:HD-like signal output (HDOD) protein